MTKEIILTDKEIEAIEAAIVRYLNEVLPYYKLFLYLS